MRSNQALNLASKLPYGAAGRTRCSGRCSKWCHAEAGRPSCQDASQCAFCHEAADTERTKGHEKKKPSLRLMHFVRPSMAYRDFCPHLPALNKLPGTAEPCPCDLHCRIQLSLAAMRFHLQKYGPDGSTAQLEVPGHSGFILEASIVLFLHEVWVS